LTPFFVAKSLIVPTNVVWPFRINGETAFLYG
jgi:hypothetical protein